MARVWIYDLNKTKKHQEAVEKAKKARRKPPARWQVSWYDNTGKLATETIANKTQAENRLSEIERTLLDGTYVDPGAAKVKFAEMADKWIDGRHDLRPSTWWKYRGLLDNHVLPRWGDLSLNKILNADEDIEVWVAILLKSKTDGGSRPAQERQGTQRPHPGVPPP